METPSREPQVQINHATKPNVTFLAADNQPNWTSKILQPFFKAMERLDEPAILDLGPINSRRIAYFGSISRKVYVCDLIRECRDILEQKATSSEGEIKENLTKSNLCEEVLDEMNLASHSLHGISSWDILDAFPMLWAQALVARLSMSLRKGGLMFAFFGPQKSDSQGNRDGLKILGQPQKENFDDFQFGREAQFYKNSDIMALFADFNVPCFYTMKNGFRGTLVQKL